MADLQQKKSIPFSNWINKRKVLLVIFSNLVFPVTCPVMVRGKMLSATLQMQIQKEKAKGVSMKRASDKLHIHLNTIRRYWRLGVVKTKRRVTGKLGRRRRVSPQKMVAIKNVVNHDKYLSASDVHSMLNLPVSVRWTRQLLRELGSMFGKDRPCVELTPEHKNARMKFAVDHVGWTDKWKSTMFTDEKKLRWA